MRHLSTTDFRVVSKHPRLGKPIYSRQGRTSSIAHTNHSTTTLRRVPMSTCQYSKVVAWLPPHRKDPRAERHDDIFTIFHFHCTAIREVIIAGYAQTQLIVQFRAAMHTPYHGQVGENLWIPAQPLWGRFWARVTSFPLRCIQPPLNIGETKRQVIVNTRTDNRAAMVCGPNVVLMNWYSGWGKADQTIAHHKLIDVQTFRWCWLKFKYLRNFLFRPIS